MPKAEINQYWPLRAPLPVGLWVELSERGFTYLGQYAKPTPSVLAIDDRLHTKKGAGLPMATSTWKRILPAIMLADRVQIDVFDGRQGKHIDRRLGDRTNEEMADVWQAAGRSGASHIIHVGCVSQRLRHWLTMFNGFKAPDCEVIVFDGPNPFRVVPLHEVAA